MDFIPGVDGQGIPRVLAAFMHALLTGEDLVLVDGGRQRRSFLYVDEFVKPRSCTIIDRPRTLPGPNHQPRQRQERTFQYPHAGAKPGMRISRAKTERRVPRLRTLTAAAFYGEGYDDSIVRIPPWPRLSACSGGARTCLSLRCCHPSWRLSGAL